MKKLFAISILILVLSITAAGCTRTSSKSSSSANGKKVVKVAVNTISKPASYVDENNKPTGYDVDVLKAINKKLPEYDFQYEPMDINAELLGTQSGKYALSTCNYFITSARKEQYLIPDENFDVSLLRLIVKKDRNDIHSLSDMAGKTIAPIPTNNGQYKLIKDYNDKHPDKKIKIDSIDLLNISDNAKGVAAGKYDASLTVDTSFKSLQNQLHLDLKLTDEVVGREKVYFLLNKNETELKTKIDKATKELKQDGTLSKLSLKWFGEDVFKN